MKKGTGIIMLCLVFCFSLLTGCAQGTKTTTASTASKKDLKFVIVPKVVHPWFDEVNKGATAEAKLLGDQLGVKVNINYVAPTKADVTEQNSILEQAAATHPDGIAVDPLDAVGNKQVIDNIIKQGIPVILFDSPAPAGSDLTSVGNDFSEQGAIAANRLIKLLNGKGKVAVMQGVPTAPNHKQRYESELAILKSTPGITVVDGGIDNDDIQTAQQQAAAVLSANPDLAGYLSCDASGPIGIANAIKEAGKKGKVTAVGMDSLNDIVQAVKDGYLESSSATIPREQGSMAILMLWQKSLGVKIPKVVDTGIDIVTKENADSFLK